MDRDVTYAENRLLTAVARLNDAGVALRGAQREIDAARKEYVEALNSNLAAAVQIISKFVEPE